ncbi:MAG TPA: ribonuclease J [Actinobacteria bacterium]|nr:ribonuclease J [Actinomycetota bacterium]
MAKKNSLKLVPLGGVSGIGKNMMVIEKNNKMIIIDCGLEFPDDETPGIDFLIPDFSYVLKNINKLQAIILTHGHEDHIGALPFLFKRVHTPIYGTKLTLGLAKTKLNNISGRDPIEYNVIDTEKILSIGSFDIEFFRVNHSIPDGVGLIIRTDIGSIIHSGDFKIDHYPIDGVHTEIHKIARAGEEGVLALLCDSTNAEEEGYTLPERYVGRALMDKFEKASKRIIVATFSSHIHRIQQIFDVSAKMKKKVVISGRSMLKSIKIASELNYLKIPENIIIPVNKIDDFPISEIVILSTGTQGEPLSALNRMAMDEHRRISIMKEDTVIISASPIPGNEKAISNTINMLIKQGAEVLYESIAGVHVSGHAAQEEIKMMISLANPLYFIPIHGENKHKIQNARIAQSMGIHPDNTLNIQNGDIVKMNTNVCRIAGNIKPKNVYVDGIGMGNIEDTVLRDRKILSNNGVIFISVGISTSERKIIMRPDYTMRGIIFIDNIDEILREGNKLLIDSINTCFEENVLEKNRIENYITDRIEKFIFKKARIRPIIALKVLVK